MLLFAKLCFVATGLNQIEVKGGSMRTPEEIRSELNTLIWEAQSVAPKLSERLDEMKRWIGQKKAGLLMRKRQVMQLLAELVDDSTFCLVLQSLSEEDREAELAQLSPSERYWYEHLFPTWFNENDPRLPTWKKKLMADEFEASDATFIEQVCLEIKKGSGDTINPYIADLSMATDLIASGTKELVLCLQLTTVRDSLAVGKQRDWESTLKYWGIQRALFLSFNPSLPQAHSVVGKLVLRHSDQLPMQCYRII